MIDNQVAFLRTLEEASFAAWPAAEEIVFDGWLLRSSEGYTKRANSANAVGTSKKKSEEIIREVENFYRARDLPPTFRLTPLAPPNLDPLLETRGYRRLDPTLVLTRQAGFQTDGLPASLSLKNLSLESWLAVFNKFITAQPIDIAKHTAILKRIESPVLFGGLSREDRVVACGLAVEKDRIAGLFDLITAPVERRRGYGTWLVKGLVEWAASRGATLAFLQVTEANSGARSLYRKLGFETQYQYWYRRLGR